MNKVHNKTIFSASEQKVLDILGERKMTIADITNRFYKDEERPLNDIVFIASVIRRINRKCVFFNKSWTLAGRGTGRAGKTVWRQPNKWRQDGKGRRPSREDRQDSRVGG